MLRSALPSLRSTPLNTETAGAAPPDAFGPFRVLHQIGAGALGPVFRAYDPDQDRLVAVKLFRLDIPPERAHQLVAGLQKLIDADLAHPAVSAPIATGLVDASVYLAQDFVAADSLDIVTREFGKASVADAIRVAGQLAGALDFAASAGVHHGALHPRDVLLSSDDARVTGLGVAQTLEELGLRGSTRLPYTAPERLAGQGWDRRADVFSLAVLIAEMMTGRRLTGTAARAFDGLPETARVDVPALRVTLMKGMAERPKDRFDTATEFAEALKHAAVIEAVTPPAVSLLPDLRLEPRLPLEAPAQGAVEALLPGDAPREVETGSHGDLSWEVPALATFAAEESAPEPALLPVLHPVLHPVLPIGEPASEDLALHARKDDSPPTFVLKPAAEIEAATETKPAAEAKLVAEMKLAADAKPAFEKSSALPPTLQRHDAGLDPAQSAVWPIALALTVGLIVGVAVGFFVFADRLSGGGGSPVAAVTTPAPTASAAPSAPTLSGPPSPPAAQPPPSAPASAAVTSQPAASPVTSRSAPAQPAAPPPAAKTPAAPVAPRPARPEPARRSEPVPPRPEAVPPRRTVPEEGRVLVRSSPAGARVVLDGEAVGVTPLTVRSLTIGSHALRVTRDGYAPEERRVIITAAQPAQALIVELVRSGHVRRGQRGAERHRRGRHAFRRAAGRRIATARRGCVPEWQSHRHDADDGRGRARRFARAAP